jgi:hypothetical protein
MASRGIPVPDSAKATVLACSDPAQLTKWVERAATATSSDGLFA